VCFSELGSLRYYVGKQTEFASEIPALPAAIGKHVSSLNVIGVQAERFLKSSDGLVGFLQLIVCQPEVIPRLRIIGIQTQSCAELLYRRC
jgi:hypothetical protein